MKKIFLIVFCVMTTLVTSADVQTIFRGKTTDGHYCFLDSVKIENITKGWSRNITDTVISYGIQTDSLPSGIDEVWYSGTDNGVIYNYRNFISGHSFSVPVNQAGEVSINIFDMLGRNIVSTSNFCSEGTYHYEISLSSAQPFILSVKTSNASTSMLLLNMTGVGMNSIICNNYSSLQYAPFKQQEAFQVEVGDQLIYTGYTHRQGQVIGSQEKIIYQGDTSSIVTLIFKSATHSTIGSYVGIIGFNNQIYSLPIDTLTSNNITQYTNFINNLSSANGTILCHAVNSALDSIDLSPIPLKLTDVTMVTFTDGLDVGSWRINPSYSSSASYLEAIHSRIFRTYIDGVPLASYAIGVKGNDVTDEVRFINDLHRLASDSNKVYTGTDISVVNKKFRDVAAKIYSSHSSHSLTITIPAPEPDSRIRLTFDNVSDASQSEYYIEGIYSFETCGILNDVIYRGVTCLEDTSIQSIPDGLFDIFTLHNLETNLGARISPSAVKLWYYIPSTEKWQINSEFTPESSVTIKEDKKSAIVMLVLDCSSSLSTSFSFIKSYSVEFLSVLAGQTFFYKPKVSSVAPVIGKLSATCGGSITNDGGLSIIDEGIYLSKYANMDSAKYYSASSTAEDFEVFVDGLQEGQTYYFHAYARNAAGISYGDRKSFSAIDYHLPTVQTVEASSNNYTTATTKGRVVNNGNQTVTERGVCYSLEPSPTIEDNKISKGSGNGYFTCNITNLEDGTTYYVRAYATNSVGTAYGEELSFTTVSCVPPTITNPTVSNISYTYISSQCSVSFNGGCPVTACGFCYSTQENPTIDDDIINCSQTNFTALIENLTAGSTYYLRAFAVNKKGIGYSEQISFTTNSYRIPRLTTSSATDLTYTTATGGGNVTDDGGQTIIERGVCYNIEPNPTINSAKVVCGSGLGKFSCILSGLTAGTTYYIRSYATNSVGTAYGLEESFSTEQYKLPLLTKPLVSNITKTSASCCSKVYDDGGQEVFERGICYATHTEPSIEDTKIICGSDTGEFNIALSNLSQATNFYIRSYAINSVGTAYSEDVEFETYPEGFLDGYFSVSQSKRVFFSKGNLQYYAGTKTWHFADTQNSYIGSGNTNISSSYNGWIDLFGWGTSGYDNKYPYLVSADDDDYGNGTNDIAGTNYDWGVHNAIDNGGNKAGLWRTMTRAEWNYLFYSRSDAENLRGQAMVGSIRGYVILPDNWSTPEGLSFTPCPNNFTANKYTLTQWEQMEDAGAVFLPLAGQRSGTSISYVGWRGRYWSSSCDGRSWAIQVTIAETTAYVASNENSIYRDAGCSVRLVIDVKE